MGSKLDDLLNAEGLTLDELMDEYGVDTVCPGICINPGCDYTTETEHDCHDGYCEYCRTKTVKSAMILLGII